jgi:hypothetical protein
MLDADDRRPSKSPTTKDDGVIIRATPPPQLPATIAPGAPPPTSPPADVSSSIVGIGIGVGALVGAGGLFVGISYKRRADQKRGIETPMPFRSSMNKLNEAADRVMSMRPSFQMNGGAMLMNGFSERVRSMGTGRSMGRGSGGNTTSMQGSSYAMSAVGGSMMQSSNPYYSRSAPSMPIAQAICDYMPRQSGEMALQTGQQVQVRKQFQNGWIEGKNLQTGQVGNLPEGCIMIMRNNDGMMSGSGWA